MNPAPARSPNKPFNEPPGEHPALAERLRANLATQAALAAELETLLSQERSRLMARDWDAVLSLCEDKNTRVSRLAILGRELDTLAAARPLPALLDALGLGAARAAMQEQATRLQRANRECRALLDHHQARVGTALRLLDRGTSAGTYGRNGYAGGERLSQKLAAA